MAVYTDVGEAELETFLARYQIGELRSYKGIAEGVENSNYLLHTSLGPYLLTLYEKRVQREDLPFFLGLMQHLADRGIDCPVPVRQTNGSMIGELAGRPAAIITFLEGMWIRRPTPVHCRAVGEALAAMHLAGRDFPLQRPNALGVDAWRPLWAQCRTRADAVAPGLVGEIEEDLKALETRWPRELPTGIVHADLFPDNVFFLEGRLSGLIDFYFACSDHLAFDLAVCLNAWCFEKDHAFNLTKARALLRGYGSVRSLTREEIDALPVLAHGAALRFMLTRLFDWLTVPDSSFVVKKDPLEYLRRMRFHRQVRSASEYGLAMEDAAS